MAKVFNYERRKRYEKILADRVKFYEYRYTKDTASACNSIESLKDSERSLPPTEEQLKKLEKLQLRCMLYGVPCKKEFEIARKSKRSAACAIGRINTILKRRLENGDI